MSTGYYRTRAGRGKKRALNAKRSLKPAEAISKGATETGDDAALASYLESTLSLVEGRPVGPEEIRAHMERWQDELRQYRLEVSQKPRRLPDD